MKTIFIPVLLLLLLGSECIIAQDETDSRRFLSFNIKYERLSTTMGQPWAWTAATDYGKKFSSGWECSAGLGLIRNAFTEKGSIAYIRYDDWIAAFRLSADYELIRFGRFRWLAGSSLNKFVSLSSNIKWIPIDRLQYPNSYQAHTPTLNGMTLDIVSKVSCMIYDRFCITPYVRYTAMNDIGNDLKAGQKFNSMYSMRWNLKKDINFGMNVEYQLGL